MSHQETFKDIEAKLRKYSERVFSTNTDHNGDITYITIPCLSILQNKRLKTIKIWLEYNKEIEVIGVPEKDIIMITLKK